ncbi:META domain-containing protein [Trinickia acidisoli]|uniref:META domain-containing protein n=1 Tax=Trinickia acidisoli TaxID=2767482 RepID=UPI001A90AB94|nr:META domain-containing protein [Trinickia acidisoli]
MSNPFIAPARGAARRRLPSCAGALAAVLAIAGCTMPTHPDSAAGSSNPLNPAAVQLLDDTSWILQSAQTSDGHAALDVPANQAAAPTLTLDTASGERRASGFAGCNRFSGPYALRSGALGLGPLATTRKTCGANADRLEQAYLDALAHVGSTLVQMRPQQQMRIIATTGITLTFTRENR